MTAPILDRPVALLIASLYFAVVAVIGLWSARRTRSARDFFARVAQAHLEAVIEVPDLRGEVWTATMRQPRGGDQHPHILALSEHVSALQERGLIRADRTAMEIAFAFLTALIGILVRSTPELVDRATAATLVDIFAEATGRSDAQDPA